MIRFQQHFLWILAKEKQYAMWELVLDFPSIPLKICFPNLEVTIVDSLNKRIGFLENLANELKLDNVHFVHARAEDFGQNPTYREKFDIVTARAVARLSVLAELCVPLVKKGGVFISMKGAAAEDELTDAEKVIIRSRCNT